jgi:hypothetical protein
MPHRRDARPRRARGRRDGLRTAGFPPEGEIVDQEWGRSLFVFAPDGAVLHIDEPDRELYT